MNVRQYKLSDQQQRGVARIHWLGVKVTDVELKTYLQPLIKIKNLLYLLSALHLKYLVILWILRCHCGMFQIFFLISCFVITIFYVRMDHICHHIRARFVVWKTAHKLLIHLPYSTAAGGSSMLVKNTRYFELGFLKTKKFF